MSGQNASPLRTRLFLAGDVMLGRGIDQIQRHPGDPVLHESVIRDAGLYIRLAERRCGLIPKLVPPGYVWGDLPADLSMHGCDLRLINLETAITTADVPAPKGINYRMNPANIQVLTALPADACVLANNHVLDWGQTGLVETLKTLRQAGIGTVGAGETRAEAQAPLVIGLANGGRLLVLAFGAESSGVPQDWEAGQDRPGIDMLCPDVGTTVAEVRQRIDPIRRDGDILVVSIHWGGNWGYAVPPEHRAMAHALVDEAGVQIVHGHSSHHPKGLEVRNGGLILYGCGDLINDYEGIGGQEEFRGDLVLGYLAEFDPGGRLRSLDLLPYRVCAFRLQRADQGERDWLWHRMNRECAPFGGRFALTPSGTLRLVHSADPQRQA